MFISFILSLYHIDKILNTVCTVMDISYMYISGPLIKFKTR